MARRSRTETAAEGSHRARNQGRAGQNEVITHGEQNFVILRTFTLDDVEYAEVWREGDAGVSVRRRDTITNDDEQNDGDSEGDDEPSSE